jgi:glucokinase-like ROK family protein
MRALTALSRRRHPERVSRVDGADGRRSSVRDRSRELVIATLRVRSAASQADIARETGLSRTTVSGVVAELRDQGLVIDAEAGNARPRVGSRGGRPPVEVRLRPSLGAVVGVDFGHRHVRVAVADLGHALLAERECRVDVDANARPALDRAAALVDEVLRDAGLERSAVLGVGMGVPGPVDHARGVVGSASILPGWVGVRAAEELGGRIGLPVDVDNDANLGALAEHTLGAGRGWSDMAYIKVSTGIGCGLLLNGRAHRGAAGTAGEIGHTCLDEGGAFCYCGNRGCLETLASGIAIVELLRRGAGEELSLAAIVELATSGDAASRRAIADAGRHIGVAVANLCNIVNPQRVVVGGQVGLAGEILLGPLRDSFRRCAVQAAADAVQIVSGELGDRAELMGAVALALRSRRLSQLHASRQGEAQRTPLRLT